jgi:hypothetical protein
LTRARLAGFDALSLRFGRYTRTNATFSQGIVVSADDAMTGRKRERWHMVGTVHSSGDSGSTVQAFPKGWGRAVNKNVLFVVGIALSALSACKGKAISESQPAAVPSAAPLVPVEKQMNAALTNDVSGKLRELLHPTGSGGEFASKSIACTAERCTAILAVSWKGGFTGSKYVTNITWSVTPSLDSSASVDSETSVIKADEDHISKMCSYLQVLTRSFGTDGGAEGSSTAIAVGSSATSTPRNAPGVASPMRGESLTPLEELAGSAHEFSELEAMIARNEWALYPAGTTDCGSEVVDSPNGAASRPKHLDMPTVQDDFERHRLVATRDAIAKGTGAIDALFRRRGTAHVKAKESQDGVALSAYDFANKRYTLSIIADGKWPAIGGEPKFAKEAFSVDTESDTNLRIGGKKLTVRGTDEVVQYSNVSVAQFKVQLPDEAMADLWSKSGVDVEYLVVQRFKSLGYHKVCKHQCVRMLGITTCGDDDVGFGEFYKTEAVGHIVKIGDNIVSEHQPANAQK